MISGLTQNYYITSGMQKISPVHQFILEIKQILVSQDLKMSNGHLWSNGLVGKALDFQSLGPMFKTSWWLHGRHSAFHPSGVDKMSTRNIWELSGKSKLPPRSGTGLEAVEPHP